MEGWIGMEMTWEVNGWMEIYREGEVKTAGLVARLIGYVFVNGHMEFILPDCDDLDMRIHLTTEEEELLLQEIAKSGKKGMDRFAKQFEQDHMDDRFGSTLKQYRDRLAKQADRVLEKRRQNQEHLAEKRFLSHERTLEELRGLRPHIIADTDRVNIIDLESIMEHDELLRLIKDDEPLTWWERIQSFLLRLRIWLFRSLYRVKYWFRSLGIFGKGRKRTRIGAQRKGSRRGKLTLSLFGGRSKFTIGAPVEDLLTQPRFRKKLLREMETTPIEGAGDMSLEEQVDEFLKRYMEAAVKREARKQSEDDEERRRELDEKKEDLEEAFDNEMKDSTRRHQEELDELRSRLRKRMEDPVENLVERHLLELGFIEKDGEKVIPTTALLERFADLIFQKELTSLPGTGSRRGRSERRLGIYEKAKMRSVYEESRMDIVSTLINTRINHPGDHHIDPEDIIVYREETAISTHVVIMFDRSSSMDENNRMEAAKRTVMALYRAVKRQKEKDRIDIIGFDTRVNLMDLMSVWDAEPRGFTNIGGALRSARTLFEDSGSDVKIAYLITDGLPEAFVDDEGRELAGELSVCLEYAMKEAGALNANLTMILLEPEEESYVDAAKAVVQEAGGKLIVTDPDKLMHEVLSDYLV
jgi:Mg-chelatase subunit ChlD